MTSTASIGGLVSGIDTNTILDQLYQVAQAPIRRLRAARRTRIARASYRGRPSDTTALDQHS